MASLAEEYPQEQERCRTLLKAYNDIGPPGKFGHAAISAVLKRADEAVAQQDTVEMIRCFGEMQGCK